MVIKMQQIIDWLKKHKFIIFLFLFSFILRLLIVITINTPVISDFKTMLDASLELVNNTSNYKSMPYFITWGYQMGHVVYQAFLLSIINNLLFLKIMNALITSLTIVMIYIISKKLSNEKAAKITSIIYSIFLFPLLLNTVLTNQLLPMLLILVAINLWITYIPKKIFIAFPTGLLLAFSNILRSETIVIITGILVYSLFSMLEKKDIKKLILSLLILLATYSGVMKLTSYTLQKSNISPSGLENKNTAWKFLTGLNIETNGMYSAKDAEVYAYDEQKTKKELTKRIKEDYKNYPLLFLKKIKIVGLNSDLSWSVGHLNQQTTKILTYLNQLFIYFFFIMALLSLIPLLKKKYKKAQVLITLITIIYFGVYLLIEVMPRYAYSIQIFEAILTSITLGYFLEIIFNKGREKNAKTRR